jgi:Tfp pilus assembly protein PilN
MLKALKNWEKRNFEPQEHLLSEIKRLDQSLAEIQKEHENYDIMLGIMQLYIDARGLQKDFDTFMTDHIASVLPE